MPFVNIPSKVNYKIHYFLLLYILARASASA